MRRKVSLDQYFTKPTDAKKFIGILDEMYPLSNYDYVVEPSAGNGSFFNQLPDNKIGLDLEPLSPGIVKCDFFEYEPPAFSKIAVIGNPPFGRRGSVAKKFINRCSEFADVIAFILPAIFSKPSFYRFMSKHFHLEYEEFVDEFVDPNGQEFQVNCVFQIWKIHDYERIDHNSDKHHIDFELILTLH